MSYNNSLLISSAPLRVSLLGGGTDIPQYFDKYQGGMVLGFGINKYVHVISQKIELNKKFKFRISYSSNQDVIDPKKIKHPIFRQVLNDFEIEYPLHFSTKTCLHAGSGLGSSSAFTVALLDMLNFIKNIKSDPIKLAKKTINIERNILGEAGGWQDQYFASKGNLLNINFKNTKVSIRELKSPNWRNFLKSRLFLVPTNITRRAHVIESSKKFNKSTFSNLVSLSKEGINLFKKDQVQPKTLGKLINESWKIKRRLSGSVSNYKIDNIINTFLQNDVYGVKLCGAGGGGVVLVIAEKEIMNKLSNKYNIDFAPIDIDTKGITRSKIK